MRAGSLLLLPRATAATTTQEQAHTWSPRATRKSQRWLPTNPAPPVTSTRLRSQRGLVLMTVAPLSAILLPAGLKQTRGVVVCCWWRAGPSGVRLFQAASGRYDLLNESAVRVGGPLGFMQGGQPATQQHRLQSSSLARHLAWVPSRHEAATASQRRAGGLAMDGVARRLTTRWLMGVVLNPHPKCSKEHNPPVQAHKHGLVITITLLCTRCAGRGWTPASPAGPRQHLRRGRWPTGRPHRRRGPPLPVPHARPWAMRPAGQPCVLPTSKVAAAE